MKDATFRIIRYQLPESNIRLAETRFSAIAWNYAEAVLLGTMLRLCCSEHETTQPTVRREPHWTECAPLPMYACATLTANTIARHKAI